MGLGPHGAPKYPFGQPNHMHVTSRHCHGSGAFRLTCYSLFIFAYQQEDLHCKCAGVTMSFVPWEVLHSFVLDRVLFVHDYLHGAEETEL